MRVGVALLVAGEVAVAATLWTEVPLVVAYVGWGVVGVGMGIAFSTIPLAAMRVSATGDESEELSSVLLMDMLGVATGAGLGGAAIAVAERHGCPPAHRHRRSVRARARRGREPVRDHVPDPIRSRRRPIVGLRRAGPRTVTRPLRVGVQLPEVEREVRWPEYEAMALAAERVGFDSVWVGDHLLYRDDGRPERGPWEVWTMLAAIAASTERVELGPLVACAGFHAPAMLAKQAATVDEVTGGRLVLALGAGWNEVEFRAFGFPFDHRASRFEESFDVVRRLLAGERVTMHGRTSTSTTPCCFLHRPRVPV